jgi:hypothetical protein
MLATERALSPIIRTGLFKPGKRFYGSVDVAQEHVQGAEQIAFAGAIVDGAESFQFALEPSFVAFDALAKFLGVFGEFVYIANGKKCSGIAALDLRLNYTTCEWLYWLDSRYTYST